MNKLMFTCDGDEWSFETVLTSLSDILYKNYRVAKKFNTIIIENHSDIFYTIKLDYPYVDNIVLESATKWKFTVFKKYNHHLWANGNVQKLHVNSPYQLINTHDIKTCKCIRVLKT